MFFPSFVEIYSGSKKSRRPVHLLAAVDGNGGAGDEGHVADEAGIIDLNSRRVDLAEKMVTSLNSGAANSTRIALPSPSTL